MNPNETIDLTKDDTLVERNKDITVVEKTTRKENNNEDIIDLIDSDSDIIPLTPKHTNPKHISPKPSSSIKLCDSPPIGYDDPVQWSDTDVGEPQFINNGNSVPSDPLRWTPSPDSPLRFKPRNSLSDDDRNKNSPNSDNSPNVPKSQPTSKQTRTKGGRRQPTAKQLEAAKLKLLRDANRANATCKSKDNCTANIDGNILKIVGDIDEANLRTLADESGINYRLTDYPKVDNSISWTHKRFEVIDEELIPNYKDSQWLIIVMPGQEYFERVSAYRKNPDDPRSIKRFLSETKHRSKSDIILIVFNLSSFLKSERAREAKNYRERFKDAYGGSSRGETATQTEGPATTLGLTELQDLRLMLELELKHEFSKWKLHIEFFEKTIDIITAIIKYTLSVAKSETKQQVQSSTGIDWAINMDKERAYDPSASAEDLTKLWIAQLQQFSQVTLPIAKAIAADYPSPFALLDQYKELTEEEGENLLTNLQVQKNMRRVIGANISKRIYEFMCSSDPDIHIGLG